MLILCTMLISLFRPDVLLSILLTFKPIRRGLLACLSATLLILTDYFLLFWWRGFSSQVTSIPWSMWGAFCCLRSFSFLFFSSPFDVWAGQPITVISGFQRQEPYLRTHVSIALFPLPVTKWQYYIKATAGQDFLGHKMAHETSLHKNMCQFGIKMETHAQIKCLLVKQWKHL